MKRLSLKYFISVVFMITLVGIVFLRLGSVNKSFQTATKSKFINLAIPSPTVYVTPTEDPIKLAEEEKKRQEEETKKFVASYGPCRFVPVLIYHHVDDKPGSLYVQREKFSQQMDYLQQKGYTTVTLQEIVDSLSNGKILPPKPLAITFDDGYKDNYLYAYPVLAQRNMKATFFIITQLVGGADYMSWEDLKTMAGNPLVTIGDHTLSHRPLTSVTSEEVKNEINSAKNILETNLGVKVNTLAYPYGNFNQVSETVLGNSGFTAAVTTHRGLTCAKLPYEMPRVRMGNALPVSYGL